MAVYSTGKSLQILCFVFFSYNLSKHNYGVYVLITLISPHFSQKHYWSFYPFQFFFFLTLISPASSQLAFHSSYQVVFSSACSFPAAAEILGIFLLIFCALLVLSQVSIKSKYYCNFHLTVVEDCSLIMPDSSTMWLGRGGGVKGSI